MSVSTRCQLKSLRTRGDSKTIGTVIVNSFLVWASFAFLAWHFIADEFLGTKTPGATTPLVLDNKVSYNSKLRTWQSHFLKAKTRESHMDSHMSKEAHKV